MSDLNLPPSPFHKQVTVNPDMPVISSEEREKIAPKQLPSAMDPGLSGDLSSSPWAKMFPSGATNDQLKMFIQTFVKDQMAEMKRQDQIHKEHMEEMKQDL